MKTINKYKIKANKYVYAFLLMILPLISFSQSLFEKYEDLDEVSTVVVTKHAFRLMGKIGGDSAEAKEYVDMVQNLDNLTVYTTEDKDVAAQIKADVKKYLKSSDLSELVRVKDKDANVKIYVREGRDDSHVKELFMFINNLNNVSVNGKSPSVVVVSLTGDIDLDKISELTDKMNIPGGKHLKKANK